MKARCQTFFAAVLLLFVGLAAPASSQERDSDTSRMQAKQLQVGSVDSGRLSQPDEAVVWRMIRLEEETTLVLGLRVRTGQRSASLTLTDATGEELESRRAGGQEATIQSNLKAGIYYVSVTSDETLEYRLSVE